MGLYNTYGDTLQAQIKIADNLDLLHFGLGDTVDIPDGVYITYEGIIVIREGRIFDEFSPDQIFDKWGKSLNLSRVCNLSSPSAKLVKRLVKRLKHIKIKEDSHGT